MISRSEAKVELYQRYLGHMRKVLEVTAGRNVKASFEAKLTVLRDLLDECDRKSRQLDETNE